MVDKEKLDELLLGTNLWDDPVSLIDLKEQTIYLKEQKVKLSWSDIRYIAEEYVTLCLTAAVKGNDYGFEKLKEMNPSWKEAYVIASAASDFIYWDGCDEEFAIEETLDHWEDN